VQLSIRTPQLHHPVIPKVASLKINRLGHKGYYNTQKFPFKFNSNRKVDIKLSFMGSSRLLRE